MGSFELNRLALYANLCGIVGGIVAYSSVAPHDATANTIVLTLILLALSFLASKHISTQYYGNATGKNETSPPFFTTIIIFTPVVLCSFEISSLIWLNANPADVSWAHFAAASAAGHNAEQLFADQ